MNGQGCSHGYRSTHLGARPSQSEQVFPHKRALLQTEILLSFISCPGGWYQTIPQVKKPDVEVLGWHAYTLSAFVRPVGHTVLPNSLKQHWRRLMLEKYILNYLAIAGGHSCSQHANCTLPQNICGILLWDKTTHFRLDFYCTQHKVHLFHDHAV